MFKQAGIVNVTTVEEVVECAVAFSFLPLPKGRRIALIGGQGGTGVGTADNCYAVGLELPQLEERTVARLREMLPPVGTSVGNPTDTGVASLLDPSLYEKAIEIVADDQNIDMLLVISTPVPACLEYVATAAKKISKPLAVSVFALPESEPDIYQFLSERRVAAYSDPKRAVNALARMVEYAAFVNEQGKLRGTSEAGLELEPPRRRPRRTDTCGTLLSTGPVPPRFGQPSPPGDWLGLTRVASLESVRGRRSKGLARDWRRLGWWP